MKRVGEIGPGPIGQGGGDDGRFRGPSIREGIQTKHGWLSEAMLAEAGARINRVTGRIDFPIRWPWLKRPVRDERGNLIQPGVRGEPIYAEDAEERWRIANDQDRRPSDERDRWD